MKTCNFFGLLISRSLDETLEQSEANDLKKHLQTCLPCRQKAESLLKMRKIFAEQEAVEKTSLYQLLYRQEISEEKENPQIKSLSLHKWLRYGSVAAALLFVLTFASHYDSNTQTQVAETIPYQDYMLSVDYPMAGIMVYEDPDFTNDTGMVESYTNVYTPQNNSYFRYIGYEK